MLTSSCIDRRYPIAPIVSPPLAPVSVGVLHRLVHLAHSNAKAVLAAPAEPLGQRQHFLSTPVRHFSTTDLIIITTDGKGLR